MKQPGQPEGLITVAVRLIVLSSALVGAFLFRSGVTHAAAPQFKSHGITVTPKFTRAKPDPSGTALFTCQDNGAAARCYGPAQMRRAYDIKRVLGAGIDGTGTTIVIIDAFQSPALRQDLDFFDKTFGLAKATLNILAPGGLTPFDPNNPIQVSWSAEISLDVEWAHAIAPGATIDLVLAKDSQDQSLLSVTKYAVNNNLGNVISQSFGEGESCMDPGLQASQHQTFQEAAKKGITVFASSGDQGAAQPTCDGSSYFLNASTPASDPLVVAVGGTYLNADAHTGKFIGEAAWNETDVAVGASGGGFSTLFARPDYQAGYVGNPKRGVPDVAYDASVNGGVLVAWSVLSGAGSFYIFGGTSAGSPQWAGMLADVDSHFGRQGDIHNILYHGFARSDYNLFYHDIKVGDNTFTATAANGSPVTINGYNTRVGWDAVTGLGSFDLGDTIFGPPGGDATSIWVEH